MTFFRLTTAVLAVSLGVSPFISSARTKVMFFFDTEDFTCDESNDTIRDTAQILTEEGVCAEYNVVGYLARELVRNRRFDVIDALKPHAIGSQTLGHSVHPTICEMTDMVDARVAYANAMRAESECLGMLKAAFGLQHIDYAVPPGNSWSYISLYVFSDLGMTFYCGSGFEDEGKNRDGIEGIVPDPELNRHWSMWYCNMLQIPYAHIMSLDELIPSPWQVKNVDSVLDRAAERDAVVFYMHPHNAIKKGHWDGPNYLEYNRVEWGKWIQVENRPKADTEVFYRNLKEFVRRVKSDSRFEITDTIRERGRLKPRVPITRAEIPTIRKALIADFGPVDTPASWSVADCLHAAVHFLRGEESFMPGRVYGFLEHPKGVSEKTVVRRSDIVTAAQKIDLGGFLPSEIVVGGSRVGTADYLFAALEVLETGADEVVVEPREQLGSFKLIPGFYHLDIKKGWPIHSPKMNGGLLDERLKLQLWTMRFE